MTIRETTPDVVKNRLRTSGGIHAKKLPDCIKAEVYKGCKDPGASIQFNRDVSVYNVFEALLYVEGYESQGFYTVGTAKAAIDAYMKLGTVKKAMGA
jgi:hypothetical protein